MTPNNTPAYWRPAYPAANVEVVAITIACPDPVRLERTAIKVVGSSVSYPGSVARHNSEGDAVARITAHDVSPNLVVVNIVRGT